MKKFLWVMASLFLVTGVSACNPDDSYPVQEITQPQDSDENPGEAKNQSTSNRMKITVGSIIFTATLADNNTANTFKAMLPMTVSMAEHAGNEKYYELSGSLPTAAFNPGTIRNGDIMLFGSKTLVLFYNTFSASYSYTRIGSVDNPSGLAQALGTSNVTVTIELTE